MKLKQQTRLILNRARRINGEIKVSPDKSISHRAMIFASLATGRSIIRNYLMAEDCVNTMKAMMKLGVQVKIKKDGSVHVKGKGKYGLKKPSGKLYFGNSGTGMRLMSGVLASQLFPVVLTGDASLTKRPMSRITVPLIRMGASIRAAEGEYPPLQIKPGVLRGIAYNSPVASAQVKSCILLAGLYTEENVTVCEPYKSRDHTERLMQHLGVPVSMKDTCVSISGSSEWNSFEIDIPGDLSSASFFITACLMLPGSSLIIKDVNLNPTRTGFLRMVKKMGARVFLLNEREAFNEPIGDIQVEYTPDLRPIKITQEDIPSIIDEIPIISLLATCASGNTIIEGAGELRKKETDRLHAIANQLMAMGQSVQEQRDSLIIVGRRSAIKGARVKSYGDHRIAMMLAVASLLAESPTEIDDIKCIDTSFPEFFSILESIVER